MVFVVWRLHGKYAVFKMQGIVGVGFSRSADQVHVLIHVHGAVVRGSTGQGAGEFYICRQLACIDSEFFHAIVRRVPDRIRLGISRIPCPDERARSVLRRNIRLALLHFAQKGNNRSLERTFR